MTKSVTTLIISIPLGNSSTNFNNNKFSSKNNNSYRVVTRLLMKVHMNQLENKTFML